MIYYDFSLPLFDYQRRRAPSSSSAALRARSSAQTRVRAAARGAVVYARVDMRSAYSVLTRDISRHIDDADDIAMLAAAADDARLFLCFLDIILHSLLSFLAAIFDAADTFRCTSSCPPPPFLSSLAFSAAIDYFLPIYFTPCRLFACCCLSAIARHYAVDAAFACYADYVSRRAPEAPMAQMLILFCLCIFFTLRSRELIYMLFQDTLSPDILFSYMYVEKIYVIQRYAGYKRYES